MSKMSILNSFRVVHDRDIRKAAIERVLKDSCADRTSRKHFKLGKFRFRKEIGLEIG